MANAMPAELYNCKPNSEEMSFGEPMIHIAGSNIFRFNQVTGIKPPFVFDPATPPASDKQSVLKLLEQSFDYVIDVLPKITAEQLQRTWRIPSWKGRNDPDGRAMVLNMFVHTAHHRRSARFTCGRKALNRRIIRSDREAALRLAVLAQLRSGLDSRGGCRYASNSVRHSAPDP
jgi:DinB superfamily